MALKWMILLLGFSPIFFFLKEEEGEAVEKEREREKKKSFPPNKKLLEWRWRRSEFNFLKKKKGGIRY